VVPFEIDLALHIVIGVGVGPASIRSTFTSAISTTPATRIIKIGMIAGIVTLRVVDRRLRS
jgi:hypothetical protein